MNGDHTVMVEILDAIEHGNLSVHETRRRLEQLIDEEIERTDAPANMQLVEECEKLLWELSTNGTIPYVSRLEENRAAVIKRAGRAERANMIRRNALRIGVAAAVLLILVIGAELLPSWEWIGIRSTQDEQQRVVEGEKVDHGMVQESIASKTEQDRSQFITTNMDEAIAFLEVDFNIPETVGNEWVLSRIDCTKTNRRINLLSYYSHSSKPQRKLTITVHRFSEKEDAYFAFEQNRTGEIEHYNGIEFYLSKNYERTRCTWLIDTCVYYIDGHIENVEALKIANQIIGEI